MNLIHQFPKSLRKIPNFVLLRAFEAAARLESFTLASVELHLTPSAISHQVRELEDHFGRPLFVRRNRRVELTPEGRRLHDSLARVFDVIEAACREVVLAPQSEVLALHCPPSLATQWLGPRLPQFMRAHPEINIRLTSGAEPIDLTRVQEVDVAISYGAPPQRAGVVCTPLGRERVVPLCAPAMLREGVPATTLMTELVLIDSLLNDMSWSRWFSLNGLSLPERPRPSFDRAALAISAAVDGVGVALESTRLAERELQRGELVELGAQQFTALEQAVHFFSYRAGERQLPKVRIFRDWLLATAGVHNPE